MTVLVPKTSETKSKDASVKSNVHGINSNSRSGSSSSSSSNSVTPLSSVDEAVSTLKQGKKRGCWATLMTGDGYMPGLAVFAHSLLRGPHASAYPLVVMTVQGSCSPEAIETVRQLGCQVVEVERMGIPGVSTVLAAARFSEVWTKLRAWDMEGYERVVLTDSDMLVRRNMDELFDLPLPSNGPLGASGIAATFACTCNPAKIKTYPAEWIPENCAFTSLSHPSCLTDAPSLTAASPPTHHLLNSGLVVLAPSSAVLASMALHIASDPIVSTYRFPDQDFLADFFQGSFLPIPYIYNALKKHRQAHPKMWRDDEVKNVHYIHKKPWDSREVGTVDEETHGWWWTEWEQRKQDRAGGVDEGLWDQCVVKYVVAADGPTSL